MGYSCNGPHCGGPYAGDLRGPTIKQTNIETVYDALALALDQAGPELPEVLLAKLASLLSKDIDGVELVCQRIKEASANLNA